MKQNTKEWLETRKNYIGASDAPIIMGVSPYKRSDGRPKTPYILWMEKLDMLPRDQENHAMRYGKEMEQPAREAYEKMVNDFVSPKVCFHKSINYLMASLDGLSIDGKLAVEIKNANAEDHSLAENKKIPEKYYPQVQQQMACADLDGMHYFSFHKGKGVIVEVKRNDDYLEEMYSKEKEFWECVENFKPPKMTKDDFRERDENWYNQALYLKDIKDQIKELEKKEEEAESILKQISERENSFYKNLRYTCSARKGTVDYSKIPELEGVDLDSYRKKHSQVWRLGSI